jgi:hypothetical protein
MGFEAGLGPQRDRPSQRPSAEWPGHPLALLCMPPETERRGLWQIPAAVGAAAASHPGSRSGSISIFFVPPFPTAQRPRCAVCAVRPAYAYALLPALRRPSAACTHACSPPLPATSHPRQSLTNLPIQPCRAGTRATDRQRSAVEAER